MPDQKKPNILVIWGDDIGIANLSCHTHRVMGYRTPNIDRLAKEGMMFTDSYGEQSCTAGRSSLLPAIPAGAALSGARGHINLSRRLPLHRAARRKSDDGRLLKYPPALSMLNAQCFNVQCSMLNIGGIWHSALGIDTRQFTSPPSFICPPIKMQAECGAAAERTGSPAITRRSAAN
jgi:Sulfatase